MVSFKPLSLRTDSRRVKALSLYRFALILDELIAHIQEEVPWCMLFVGDILLIDELRDDGKL